MIQLHFEKLFELMDIILGSAESEIIDMIIWEVI